MEERVKRTIAALQKHQMGAQYVETAADVVRVLEGMLHEGDVVTVGGSVTLGQCGVLEHLRSGRYSFLDRYEDGADVDEIFRDAFYADAYITSTNAVTEDGLLVNMDGNANRVAAMAFGPARVVVVAGINKIVPDEPAAQKRIHAVAAPKNAARLHCDTPCAKTGKCENCRRDNPGSICCTYVAQGMQRKPGRIQVILVGESLGY